MSGTWQREPPASINHAAHGDGVKSPHTWVLVVVPPHPCIMCLLRGIEGGGFGFRLVWCGASLSKQMSGRGF